MNKFYLTLSLTVFFRVKKIFLKKKKKKKFFKKKKKKKKTTKNYIFYIKNEKF